MTSKRDVAQTRAAEGMVEIAASPERVWRALTEAAELERWFPLEARVEPGEGGSIFMSWKNEYQGASTILAWEPGRHLRISWGSWDDSNEGQVTDYYLEARGGKTVVRAVTSGFPTDATWDDWVEGTRLGWRFELQSLKTYLEHHAGRDREVLYLRRRVQMSRQAAWARLTGSGGVDTKGFRGTVLDDSPPRQYAVVMDDPPHALLRISTEPCMTERDAYDVNLWLSVWGQSASPLTPIAHQWAALLERVFPEGDAR